MTWQESYKWQKHYFFQPPAVVSCENSLCLEVLKDFILQHLSHHFLRSCKFLVFTKLCGKEFQTLIMHCRITSFCLFWTFHFIDTLYDLHSSIEGDYNIILLQLAFFCVVGKVVNLCSCSFVHLVFYSPNKEIPSRCEPIVSFCYS